MAHFHNTDREWEAWGKLNPYHAALSDPKYLAANLNDKAIDEFFSTGEQHADRIYSVIRERVQPGFKPARVLDYGCGVGRVLIPLAKRAKEAVGIDVSPAMLQKAWENCWKFGTPSVRLLHVDQMDSLEPESFDFVHSFIVFQHIPVARGEVIVQKIVELIANGGTGAIHVTFSNAQPVMRRGAAALRQYLVPVHGLLNLAQRRPLSSPRMQMNIYSMNRILEILIEAHCSNLHVEFSNHCGIHGAMLYFEKTSEKVHQRDDPTLANVGFAPPEHNSAPQAVHQRREMRLEPHNGGDRIPPFGIGGGG